MRIEVLGPSGVGKSTVLEAARERCAPAPEWIGPSEANRIVPEPKGSVRRDLLRAGIDNPEWRSFVDHCTSVALSSSMLPSQKVSSLMMLRASCSESLRLRSVSDGLVLVHDELLLHRAYSLLLQSRDFERDARVFFELAPAPDVALIFTADEDAIAERVGSRGRLPNCYFGQDLEGLRRLVARGVEINRIAGEVLMARNIPVRIVEVSSGVDQSADEVNRILQKASDGELE